MICEGAMQSAAALSVRAVRPSVLQALLTFRFSDSFSTSTSEHVKLCIFSLANKQSGWLLSLIKLAQIILKQKNC